MRFSLWRYVHLILAIVTSGFLVIASVTGIVLAVHSVDEQVSKYQNPSSQKQTIAQLVQKLQHKYSEIHKIESDYKGVTSVEAIDNQGEIVKGYIDTQSGEIMAPIYKKSKTIQWITTLHRSLFLHEKGRFVMGIVSLFLFLIAFSGIVLIVKRFNTIRYFFSKIVKESFAQYYHIILGRILLIPISIVSLTAVYLFGQRFVSSEQKQNHLIDFQEDVSYDAIHFTDFHVFRNTQLKELKSLEFPFSDDQDEYFLLKLKDRELCIHQFSGEILSEIPYGLSARFAQIALDWHTGRTNVFWALVLALACVGILFFIYSGFAITFTRKSVRFKNRYSPNNAEFVILFGSENANTLHFANTIHKQMLFLGCKSYLAELNQYTLFPQAKHILIFTSTYAMGEAPSNAQQFLHLLHQKPQIQKVNCSVVGFGSSAYPDFCKYAQQVHQSIVQQNWASLFLDLYTIDNQSVYSFVEWVKQWNAKSHILLSTQPAFYQNSVTKLQEIKVVSKTEKDQENVFKLTLKTQNAIRSGDLLAIYPNGQERLYSIAKVEQKIQLIVKLHDNGLGSGYLYSLKEGDVIQGRIIKNPNFYLPKKKKNIIFIANGTGIAPFLGMLQEAQSDCRLYAGFRKKTDLVQQFLTDFEVLLKKGILTQYQIAYSQQENKSYVTDLLKKEAVFLASFLEKGGVFMLCGSIAMCKDVEILVDEISTSINHRNLDFYKAKGQWWVDCY